jgi:hypothetical protein
MPCRLDNTNSRPFLQLTMARSKQSKDYPQHAEIIFTPFGPNSPRIPFEPSTFKVMSKTIGVATCAAAPRHIRDTGIRAWNPGVARCQPITGGIAADEIVVVGGFVDNGDNCVGGVDEETGAFGDGTGNAKLAAFDCVGAFD